MTKKRINIPKKSRDAVLREFHHRCAICGTNNPQIHHIDEDPANNAIENLLPLCPNCHYLDQHDPTSPIESQKLQLFRRYKDPLILSPQFEPLFHRCEFLIGLNESEFDVTNAKNSADELVQFISELEMGSFYAKRIGQLVKKPAYARVFGLDTPDYVFRQWAEEEHKNYFEKLTKAVNHVLELVVELLRYQSWTWKPNST